MHDLNLARAKLAKIRSERQRRHDVDQHLLVDTMTVPTHARAPKGVQVHRPERSGAGFARHEWFSPLSHLQNLPRTFPCLG